MSIETVKTVHHAHGSHGVRQVGERGKYYVICQLSRVLSFLENECKRRLHRSFPMARWMTWLMLLMLLGVTGAPIAASSCRSSDDGSPNDVSVMTSIGVLEMQSKTLPFRALSL